MSYSIYKSLNFIWSFPGDSMLKSLPVMQETQVQPLGQKNTLQKELATCTSTLSLEITLTEDYMGYSL